MSQQPQFPKKKKVKTKSDWSLLLKKITKLIMVIIVDLIDGRFDLYYLITKILT
ncbi:hypothetical protein skT53_14930 [Effusibacillus dendaii]|uniref:Uncharacterized protein n=1 Tax=Effusibacillus dendaii TaxID=2743772 RepID=A0A7I8D8P1_9BACL|nr:hypothetical protein skT53_14930 [Effusibacillus dendaii]